MEVVKNYLAWVYDLGVNEEDFILQTYFEWCKSGKSENRCFDIFRSGEKAYLDFENSKIYLSKNDYFIKVILKDNDFLNYIEKELNANV